VKGELGEVISARKPLAETRNATRMVTVMPMMSGYRNLGILSGIHGLRTSERRIWDPPRDCVA